MKKTKTAPHVVVVMPAYNAEATLKKTYLDIPKDKVSEILVVDDVSCDRTVAIAKKLRLPIFVHDKNLGYGGNQKTCYKKALEIEPLDDNSLYNSGTAYTMEGNFQRALTRFKQALLVNPSNTDVLYNLAYAHEQLGNPSAALESYQKVISLQPSSPDAHFRIAGIYQAEGNCPAAISHYQEVVKIAPQFAHEVNQCISRCQP